MKTIEEIKKDVAVGHGFDEWNIYDFNRANGSNIDLMVREIAIEYAKQRCDEQIQDCYINAEVKTICESVFDNNEGGYFDIYKVVVCEESILNTPNVVTTNTK